MTHERVNSSLHTEQEALASDLTSGVQPILERVALPMKSQIHSLGMLWMLNIQVACQPWSYPKDHEIEI